MRAIFEILRNQGRKAKSEDHRTTIYDRFPRLTEIPQEGFPTHLALIPDGNRREARMREEDVILGQRRGVAVALEIFRDLRKLPIDFVTIWGFSADNWKRSQEEVDGLMDLFADAVGNNYDELVGNNVRFVHLGRKDRIPKALREILAETEIKTRANTGQTLALAIDFGGTDQEVRIAQSIARLIQAGTIQNPATDINEQFLDSLRDGEGLVPPADLLIRTSGERRTSDIGWLNGPQTELYFIDKLFPTITTADIVGALLDFSKRQRRQGA